MSCTFCDLIQGSAEVSVCYEDAEALAFMDIQPVNAGHVLVVPRKHYESLLDVPQELGAHLFAVTMKLANAVRRVTGCEGMNLVVNSGVAAGQDVFHYHVHIIPRRKDDGFDIELPFAGSEMPDRTVLDMTAARILAAMRDPMRAGGGGGGASGGSGSLELAGPGDEVRSERPAARELAPLGDEVRSERPAARELAPLGDEATVSLRARDAERSTAIAVHREPEVAAAARRRDEEWPSLYAIPGEGPHGELVRDPEPIV